MVDSGGVLVAVVPGGIAASTTVPLATWLTPLLEGVAPSLVVTVDVAGAPTAVVRLPGDAPVAHLAAGVGVPPSLAAVAPPLPAPLMLDSAPAAVITRALESGSKAIALRCFAPPSAATSLDAGGAMASALRLALVDALGVPLPPAAPRSATAADPAFRALFASHARRAAASGDAMAAAVLYT